MTSSLSPLLTSFDAALLVYRDAAAQAATSAHATLIVRRTRATVEATLQPLTALLHETLPTHWGHDRHALTLSAKGHKLYWSAVKGRSPRGLAFSTEPRDLRYHFTMALHLAILSQTLAFKSDTPFLHHYALQEGIHPFLFRTASGITGASGTTPVDAFARMLWEGAQKTPFSSPPKALSHTTALETKAISKANTVLHKNGRQWSASLALWDRLMAHPTVQRLRRANPIHGYNRAALQTSVPFYHYATILHDIEQTLAHITPAGPLQLYMVGTPASGFVPVKAWDPVSAALWCRLKQTLRQQDLLRRFEPRNWSIFAATPMPDNDLLAKLPLS